MPNQFKPFLNRLAAVFGSGAIFLFFSEFFFLNEGPVREISQSWRENPIITVLGTVEFILFYAFFTYGFLIILGAMRVRNIWTFFLAACIFGWIVEGVIIPVIYEFPVVSYAWTAIGWHALIDVLIGWVLVRKILEKNKFLLTALLAVGLGLLWSYWATWVWTETSSDARITPAEFTLFAYFVSTIWIAGTIILDKWGGTVFRPTKTENYLIGGATLLGAIYMSTFAFPYSLTFWPLLAFTLFAIWRGKTNDDNPLEIFASFNGKEVNWLQYPILFLTPLVASTVYPFYYKIGISLDSSLVIWPLIIIGTGLFCVALFKSLKGTA